jgi:ribosomal protein L23
MLETGNVYTFLVANDATKTDIKKAFHELYDREVSSVQIAKNHLKTRNGKKGNCSSSCYFQKSIRRTR